MIYAFVPKSPYSDHYAFVDQTMLEKQQEAGEWATQNCDHAKVLVEDIPIPDPGHSHSAMLLPICRHYGTVIIVGDADAVKFKLMFGELFETR